ncbi:hypothetical protein D3C84_588910 [compost metagenome]
MGEHAARRLLEAHPAKLLVRRDLGLDVGAEVPLADVVDERLPLVRQGVFQHAATHRPAYDAAHGGVQLRRLDGRAGQRLVDAVELIEMGHSARVLGRQLHQQVGERAHFDHLAVEGGGFDPGVLAVILPAGVVRLRLALPGLEGGVILVPGVLVALGDAIHQPGVLMALYGAVIRQIAVFDVAARHQEAAAVGIGGELGHAQIVFGALPQRQPLGVVGGDDGGIHLVDLLDELAEPIDEGLHIEQPLEVEHAGRIQVDGVGHPAHRQVLDVGRLAPQDGDDAVGIALALQGLQVVSHGDEVHLRAQLHRLVAPIAVGEDAELAARHQGADLLLHLGQLFGAVEGPGRHPFKDARRFLRIGLQRCRDVHPVQRRELVEVDYVIVDVVGRDDEVADELCVDRHLGADGILHRPHRGDGVDRGADPADALHYHPGVARIVALEDLLHAAPHGAG